MKILHTADWHFGKQLYGHSLAEEMYRFTEWLVEVLQSEKIDILLISGDIFDVTNPSNLDKERYFSFLKLVREHHITTIITGGNHDSISFLNSSKEYLKQDNIFVVGGATENIEDEILHFKINDEEVVICAVPFLRDRDLREQTTDHEFSSRSEAIQYGLKTHYQSVLELAKAKYPTLPIIAMGHLFAIGSSTSESERDIHIGNSGAVSHEIFNGFDYVALGHIHKPQIIHKNEKIRYSGSPIPLSFSEKKDDKQVVIISVENGKIQLPKVVKVPKFRSLLRFSGTLQEVQQKINSFEFAENQLSAFIELQINEENYNLEIIQNTNLFVEEFNATNEAKIVFNKIKFKTGSKNIEDLFEEDVAIENLEVSEVFHKRLLSELPDAEPKEREELEETFRELLDVYFEG
ncbi:MAG: exonuclease subunit SbcD [Flavobacteriaceae bacterium]|nr:exonuclease subunit SbcD [Flavobacteriaceae bacterium]